MDIRGSIAGDYLALTVAGGLSPGGAGRTKRPRPPSYDEVTRRKPRRAGPRGYMERSGSRVVTGGGIASRVVGTAAVERMVAGRYEWRDGGLRPMRGARKRHWEECARGDG